MADISSWRNLGLIHLLVVSGGHLTILAGLLTVFSRACGFARKFPRLTQILIAISLLTFALANRFEPPVLRAFFDWCFRGSLKSRGWRTSEISFASSWMALPFVEGRFDLLSLGLSLFASLTVDVVLDSHRRNPIRAAVFLQIALWWLLLPLLLPLGMPHPISALGGLLATPILGVGLIPLGLMTWLTNCLAVALSSPSIQTWSGEAFRYAWKLSAWSVSAISDFLPASSDRIPVTQGTFLSAFVGSSAWIAALVLALSLLALLVRTESKLTTWKSTSLFAIALLMACSAHATFPSRTSTSDAEKKKPAKVADSKKKGPRGPCHTREARMLEREFEIKRGTVCTPCRANERLARSKHCRRRR